MYIKMLNIMKSFESENCINFSFRRNRKYLYLLNIRWNRVHCAFLVACIILFFFFKRNCFFLNATVCNLIYDNDWTFCDRVLQFNLKFKREELFVHVSFYLTYCSRIKVGLRNEYSWIYWRMKQIWKQWFWKDS